MTDILKKIKEFNKTLANLNKMPNIIQTQINNLNNKVNSFNMFLPDHNQNKKYIGLLLYENNSLNNTDSIDTNKLNNFITLKTGNYIITYNISFKNISSTISASIGIKDGNKVQIIKNSRSIYHPKKQDANLTCTLLYHTDKDIDICVILNNNDSLNKNTFDNFSILSITKI